MDVEIANGANGTEDLKEGVQTSLKSHENKAKRLYMWIMMLMTAFAVEFVVLAFLPIFVLDTDTEATVIALVITDCIIALVCTMSWVTMSGSMSNMSTETSIKDMETLHQAEPDGNTHSWVMAVHMHARTTVKHMHSMMATFLSVAVVVLLIKLPNGIAEDTDAGLYDAIMLTITRKRLAMIILAFSGLVLIEPPINHYVTALAKHTMSGMHMVKSVPSEEDPALNTTGSRLGPSTDSPPLRAWLTPNFVFNTAVAWLIVTFAIITACIVGTQATSDINISNSNSWVFRLSLLLICSAVLWATAQCVNWANTNVPTWVEEVRAVNTDTEVTDNAPMWTKAWKHVPSFRNPAFTKIYIEWSLNLCLATVVMIIPYLHHGSLDPTMETPKSQELLTSMIIATTPMVLVLLHGSISLVTAVVPSMKALKLPRETSYLVQPPSGANAIALRSAAAIVFIETLTCATFLFISLLGIKSLSANSTVVSSVMVSVVVLATAFAAMFLVRITNTKDDGSLPTLYTQVNIIKAMLTLLLVIPIACAAAMTAEVKHPQDLASPQKYWANILAHVLLLYGVSQVASPLFRGFIPAA